MVSTHLETALLGDPGFGIGVLRSNSRVCTLYRFLALCCAVRAISLASIGGLLSIYGFVLFSV